MLVARIALQIQKGLKQYNLHDRRCLGLVSWEDLKLGQHICKENLVGGWELVW